MAKLEEILLLIVLSGALTPSTCSQQSHGSYSHYLDKKSYIYRSAIGLPNTGDGGDTKDNDNDEEDDTPEIQAPEARSLGEETGYQSANSLYSFPYTAYQPYQQQEIYKRNALSSPDLNGPPLQWESPQDSSRDTAMGTAATTLTANLHTPHTSPHPT